MSQVWEPINRYKKAGHPDNDADPVGGVRDTLITDGVDNFIPSQPIPTSGGDLSWFYAEGHLVANGGGHAVPSPGWYVKNGLFRPTAATPMQLVSDDPDDVGIVRLTFTSDTSGLWDTEEVQLNGTTTVPAQISPEIGTHVYAESVSEGGALEAATGNRFIFCNGSLMGKILVGQSTAASLFRIAIAQEVDNNYEAANRLTNPHTASATDVGSFTEAFSPDTRLQLPAAADVGDGEEVDIWWQIIAPEDMPAPIGQLKPVLSIYVLT